jgi:hypothetical protein
MLGAIITSKCRRKVLTLLIMNPEQEYYLRQIARLTDQPIRSVQLETHGLVTEGVIVERREANRRLFRVNPKFYYHNELKGLIMKTTGLQYEVEKHLVDFKKYVRYAVLDLDNFQIKPESRSDGVLISLYGNFEGLKGFNKERLLNITSILPFKVKFNLVPMEHGMVVSGEGENKILLYSQGEKERELVTVG